MTEYLTTADIVRLGEAVLTLEGQAVGFDHSVVEQIVARHVAAAVTEARAAALNEAAEALDEHALTHGDPADNGHIYADLLRNFATTSPPARTRP